MSNLQDWNGGTVYSSGQYCIPRFFMSMIFELHLPYVKMWSVAPGSVSILTMHIT